MHALILTVQQDKIIILKHKRTGVGMVEKTERGLRVRSRSHVFKAIFYQTPSFPRYGA